MVRETRSLVRPFPSFATKISAVFRRSAWKPSLPLQTVRPAFQRPGPVRSRRCLGWENWSERGLDILLSTSGARAKGAGSNVFLPSQATSCTFCRIQPLQGSLSSAIRVSPSSRGYASYVISRILDASIFLCAVPPFRISYASAVFIRDQRAARRTSPAI